MENVPVNQVSMDLTVMSPPLVNPRLLVKNVLILKIVDGVMELTNVKTNLNSSIVPATTRRTHVDSNSLINAQSLLLPKKMFYPKINHLFFLLLSLDLC